MAQVCWSSATAAASAPEAHRAFVDRYVEARFYGNCNCGCPCQFEDLPTQGHCRGFEVMEIDRGHFGETDLAGLRSAVLCVWPRPIIEGRGEMQAIIGERATPAQRRALQTVLHGGETEAARTHWWVFHAMSDTVHPTLYRPIDFEADIEVRTARVSIADVRTSTGRPIRNREDGADHRVGISMPDGIEFDLAEIGNASTEARGAIRLDLEDSYGQWHLVRQGPAGVVR